MKKDYVSLYKPLFCGVAECKAVALWALTKVGCPYDYQFKSGNEKYYCSELVYSSYHAILGENRCAIALWRRGRHKTILPNDIDMAKTKFERIASSALCW